MLLRQFSTQQDQEDQHKQDQCYDPELHDQTPQEETSDAEAGREEQWAAARSNSCAHVSSIAWVSSPPCDSPLSLNRHGSGITSEEAGRHA